MVRFLFILALAVVATARSADASDCRLGTIAFEQTGYVIDIGEPRARIAARLVAGRSRDPLFDWIPDDIAAAALRADSPRSPIEWTSSDPSIAAVDAGGNVSALRVGTVTVTARTAQAAPQPASVSVVALRPGAVIVPARDIDESTLPYVEVRRSRIAGRLQPGAVVVAGDGSLVVRLLALYRASAKTLRFRTAAAAAGEAFAAGSVLPPAAASCR
jgi:hypothetical protein